MILTCGTAARAGHGVGGNKLRYSSVSSACGVNSRPTGPITGRRVGICGVQNLLPLLRADVLETHIANPLRESVIRWVTS